MSSLFLISYIALWVLFLIVAFVLLSVLRNLGIIYESLSSNASVAGLENTPTNLKAGGLLPDIIVETLRGEESSLSHFKGEKMAFSIVSTGCGACTRFLEKIKDNNASPDPLDPSVEKRVIICTGNIDQSTQMLKDSRIKEFFPAFLDTDNSIFDKWGITTFPATIITNQEMRVVRQSFGG